MPNGGVHWFAIGHCPACGHTLIQLIKGRHFFNKDKWHCCKCSNDFDEPHWEGADNSNIFIGPPRWAVSKDEHGNIHYPNYQDWDNL